MINTKLTYTVKHLNDTDILKMDLILNNLAGNYYLRGNNRDKFYSLWLVRGKCDRAQTR